jgi:hypothetical protein
MFGKNGYEGLSEGGKFTLLCVELGVVLGVMLALYSASAF